MAVFMAVFMTVFAPVLLAVWAADAPAWADSAKTPSPTQAADWSAMDAEVERGVEAFDAGDYATAKAILLPLAQAGHPKAMNMIGLMHDGTDVFPNDPKQECDWYERAAEAGYSSGMYNLSICYNHGRGREQNHGLMLHWRKLAADHGSTNAMINLASLDTRQGPDYRHWMNKAAEHGSRYAPVSLWLQGYKDDARKHGMTIGELVCVSWNILILDDHFDACD